MTATIISLCASLVSGVTLFFVQRFFKNREKKEEEKDAAAKRETS
jgi:C4-dicarboxylate transporter